MVNVVERQEGICLQSAVVNYALAGIANSAVLFQISNFAQMIGTKSIRIKKILFRNNAAGACWLHIGTGLGALAFVDIIPPLRSLNNVNGDWEEVEIPSVEAFADITAYPDVLAAGGSLDVQIEVEEIG